MLLKIQTNELLQELTSAGLNPIQFTSLFYESSNIHGIHYTDKRYFFNIKPQKATYYSISGSFPRIATESNYLYLWDNVIKYFRNWANILKNELESPDLWIEMQTNAKIFLTENTVPDEKFNNHEIRELQAQLRYIEQQLVSTSLPRPAVAALTETIKSAPEKAERFTKKEWQAWFIGAIVAQVTNLALSPEHVNTVYNLLKSTFTTLLLN